MQGLLKRTTNYFNPKPVPRPFNAANTGTVLTRANTRPKLGLLNRTRNYFNPERAAQREAAYQQRMAELDAIHDARVMAQRASVDPASGSSRKSRKNRKSRKTRRHQRR